MKFYRKNIILTSPLWSIATTEPNSAWTDEELIEECCQVKERKRKKHIPSSSSCLPVSIMHPYQQTKPRGSQAKEIHNLKGYSQAVKDNRLIRNVVKYFLKLIIIFKMKLIDKYIVSRHIILRQNIKSNYNVNWK